MALVLKDRVKETTTTTGTGTITLAGAATGYQSFSVIGNSNTCYYTIAGSTEWEVGVGTYTSSGTTLSRDTVLSSSNSGALVNFSAGTKDVFVTYPADKAVMTDATQSLTNKTLGSGSTWNGTAVAVGYGGTGLTAGTSGGLPYFSASNALSSSALLAANALMVGGGAGTAPSTVTTGTGVVTALGVNTGTAGAFVVNGGALGTPSSGTVTNLTGTASININGTVGATTPAAGAFTTLSASSTVSGTGFSTYLASPPAIGGTTPAAGSFTSLTSISASGILTRAAATQDGVELIGRAGGTGSYKVTFTPTTLSASRTITLPNADINFTTGLAVAQGGTGLTAGTSGGIPYYSSTSAMTSSALLTANALMVGGGAGAAPSTVTTGTGVVTALGVNTGTAGAFVVNGGALGTPSSGTVTNLTGTASININGTVGATTPNTGAFTTLSASSTVSGTGFSTYLASPPAIGGTTPAAGSFTSLTSTSASGILTRAAATQDGVELIGRAGGTSSYKVTFTPTTLSASRTITLPDAAGVAVLDTATQTLTNKTLTDPAIVGAILEDVYTITDGAAFEIDPGNGTIQLITLGASRTPKATNFAAGESVTLMVDDGTAYTLTWTDATWGGSGVVWKTDSGNAPTLNTTGYTAIVLWKVGTQVYGARVGNA